MSNRSIRWVIGFGIVAIVAILAGQAYFFYKAFDLRERQTVQSFKISLQTVAESICRYNECTLPDNVIHQYSPNYFIVDISNHIDPWILEHYLRSELNRRHLDLDFEYAIYDCDDDKMVYGNYVSLGETERKKEKLEYWPKYEEGTYYFGVHFPGMRSYILGEMYLWYFFTAILAVVIIFFGYSMMVILHQKRLSEVQRDFINNMSHEIRTPLTSIGLANDVLSEEGPGGDPERFKKFSAILGEQIHLLQEKVDRVLQQAETERRFFRLKKQRLSLAGLAGELAGEFRLAAEHRGGSLKFTNTAGLAEVMADPDHLSGVMINLLDNAMKYTRQGPQVEMRIDEDGRRIFLRIGDSGLGIEKKYLRKVFLPFFRIPSGNVHNVKGSGLGLSYVKRICDLHRWKVRIVSAPGKGTLITIIIPKA